MTNKPTTHNGWVDAQAVADHFGVSTWTVGLWRREGRIPSCKIGYRTVRYDLAAVARALATGTKKVSGRKARKPTPRRTTKRGA